MSTPKPRHGSEARRPVGRPVDGVSRAQRAQQILQGARRCFVRDGFQGAGVASIAAEAGVSVANLYQYFESKEALILAIVEDDLKSDLALIQGIADADSFMDGFEAGLAAISDPKEEAALRLEVLAEGARNPRVARRIAELEQESVEALADVLGKAQARGEVRADLNVQEFSEFLLCVADGWFGRRAIGMGDTESMLHLVRDVIGRSLATGSSP